MICYEITNPSDAATFLAPDREVALAGLAFIGHGACGGKPLMRDGKPLPDTEVEALRVPIFLFGGYDDWWPQQGWVEEPIGAVLRERTTELVAALRSCAYGDAEDRFTYDSACAAITDPDLLAKFKADWEDRRRGSMNAIVKRAWKAADAIEKREAA